MVTPKDKVEARKRLFATRFKTEMCRTYSAEGACPYEGRCMFAHGAGDLRTEAMNERDGLTSALAVREWLGLESPCNNLTPRSPPVLCTASTSSQSKEQPKRATTYWRHEPYSFCTTYVMCLAHS